MAKNIFKNPNFAFWLFTISVAIGLTLPWLVQEGMFMDGLLYSCVSRNLGHGIGSFWFPQFSELNVGGLPSFHEQPPLVFGIQAIFFYFFGNSIYIERGYTFLMLLLSIYFIYLIWKEINSSTKDQIPYGWLAILLWISTSLAFWSFRHNMQENTMGIFTLLSVLFIFKGFNKPNNQILFFSVSGVFITLSLLSKGFPGLFPISVPFLYWITHRKPGFAKMFSQSAILLMIPVLIITLLLLFPDSRQSLSYYFFDRILQRIDYMPTIENRFYIINRLLMELIASVIIVFLFAISLYLINVKLITKSNSSLALLFILIGFS
ncbi:MAG: glycosyltransferase family 39 protein, partial [Bacteroidota bacterium]|nr:glycosyltransferase family 39 protein [Bacteroidota bacterium]